MPSEIVVGSSVPTGTDIPSKRVPKLAAKLRNAHDTADLDAHHAKLVQRHQRAEGAGHSVTTAPIVPADTNSSRAVSEAQDEIMSVEDEGEPSEIELKRKRSFVVEDDDDSSSSDIELISDSETVRKSKVAAASKGKRPRKKKAKTTSLSPGAASKDIYNADGFLADISVQAIKPVATTTTDTDNGRKDIDHFFAPPQSHQSRRDGTMKKHNKCLFCKDWIISDTTNLRRHIETKHYALFHAWSKQEGFESRLRRDVSERRAALDKIKAEQKTLDVHLHEMPKEERNIRYSELVFKRVAVEWLAETDQPIGALEHPAFRRMIQVASQATNGVKIPDRRAARKEIMDRFNEQMGGLKARFTSNAVTGEISLTCDAWQASNLDAYFAVTGHFIETQSSGGWKLISCLIGFTRLNNAHNGERLGQALFKIVDRLGISHRIGHVTCDNASNNGTMLEEFSRQIKLRTKVDWDPVARRINCLAHVINLATQAFLSTYSSAPHYNPHEPNTVEETVSSTRDEIGLVRAIAVKERSSAIRKELFLDIQRRGDVQRPLQLMLDMKVRWSSTYMMLHRAESRKEHVDVFVYEIGAKETNLEKRRKLDSLKLSPDEWENVSLVLRILSHSDNAQQAFSSEKDSTLHIALPVLEALYSAWSSRTDPVKYAKYQRFAPALEAAMTKVDEYYNRTDTSEAYIVAMYLSPETKGSHFKKYWSAELCQEAQDSMERIFAKRWDELHRLSSSESSTSAPRLSRKVSTLLRELSDDEDDDAPDAASSTSGPSTQECSPDSSKPYWKELNDYLFSKHKLREGMTTVGWWGTNAAEDYPTWASLARDFLPIMASSVSSERAFSQAGITISDRRNRLKADVVEALQFLKCLFKHDLLFPEPAPSTVTEQDLLAQELDALILEVQGESPENSWDLGLLDSDDMDLYEL